jgi:preprotein translocase subunit SecY
MVPGVSGLVLGALFTGGGFLSVVQLSIQHGRELAPHYARYMAGLLTTGYAIGQLVGPMLSAVSTALTQRLEPALYVAAVALVIAGLLVINTPDRDRAQKSA